MSNARVRFEVVRHPIHHPELGLTYIPRTPGVVIEVTYDLGDELRGLGLLESAIDEARQMMKDIVAKAAPAQEKRTWASDQIIPTDLSFTHPAPKKIDLNLISNRKWWRRHE